MNTEIIQAPLILTPATLPNLLDGNANGFDIPIYQRLYAWEQKEVLQLLVDISTSLNQSSNREYYIGNLTLNYNFSSNRYDIIDGQQRITTLWLIGLVLRAKTLEKYWDRFLQVNGKMSLHFVAREHDNTFLQQLYEKNTLNEINQLYGPNVNTSMVVALKVVQNFMEAYGKSGNDVKRFSDYVFDRVTTAAIFLPAKINLNKYFEDMNNRGLQLEPHHIVKAALLKNVQPPKRLSCSQAWDAVSQMNIYLENGFENGNLSEKRKQLKEATGRFFANAHDVNVSTKQLYELVTEAITLKFADDKYIEYTGRDRLFSIVKFPEFLLHSLRLYKKDNRISLDDKKLVEIFKKHLLPAESQNFIEFLLNARIAFDDNFIKSVEGIKGTNWEIKFIGKTDEEYDRRENHNKELVQLQSMLYVSTATSLWFTEALGFSLNKNFSEETFIAKLEEIERTIHGALPALGELNTGTRINRYWFYKLDYLLWKKWREGELPKVESLKEPRALIRNFQFRDNRSVEHVHPQNPFNEVWEAETYEELIKTKDNFGNLALISSSSNSSYQHQSFENKKADFIKRTNNWGLESLKLLAIYAYPNWTIDNMKNHQAEMLTILMTEYQTEKSNAQPNQ